MSNDSNPGIINVCIESEMKSSYLEYAMSVIVSRAIPDVRDGLKPVQRRILYAMGESNLAWNRSYKKSAKVVGEVISKYHPHGDSSIYFALVGMAQDFGMGHVLVDGQGNFGSIDADPPAAMRYTEVRLAKLAHQLLNDIDKNTVDFRDNYDGSEKEPIILPAAFPNILINGSEGIAVGMATNVPPHNLGEIIDACHAYIKNNNVSDIELLDIVKGPDFPTGATMIDRSAIARALITGRGSIIVRGNATVEELEGRKEAIIITEIPYQVVKSKLIEKIAELVKDKRIDGISNIRDESNKDGIRVVIETKRDASAEIVLNQLYKYTPLQSSFAVNMLLLNGNKPELMGIRGVIKAFIEFRERVVFNRINFFLNKARDRAHIMIGLHVAVDSIDKVIAIIRSSPDQATARKALTDIAWPASESVQKLIKLICDKNNTVTDHTFRFTEEQVRAILDMRLSRLTGLEKDKIVAELEELGSEIADHLSKLSDRREIMKIVSDELVSIKEEFAIPRRTRIEDISSDTSIDDLIKMEDMLVTITRNGYIKRVPLDTYGTQKRGGKGKIGVNIGEDDDIFQMLISNTHCFILFFSDRGIVYKMKNYQLPLGSSTTKGRAIVNLLPLNNGKITNFLSLPLNKDEWAQYDMIFATKKGNVRRSSISDFSNINAGGKIAITLDEDDTLIGVQLAHHNDNVLLATKNGMAIRFDVEDLRVIKSRHSDGVRGITLNKGDEVISLSILANNENDAAIKDMYLSIPLETRSILHDMVDIDPIELTKMINNDTLLGELSPDKIKQLAKDEQFILTITDKGHGKRTSAYEYRIIGRGGRGVINMDTSRGNVIASFVAKDEDDIVLVSTSGKVIRCSASSISIIGRNTKGVKVFDTGKSETVISVSKIDCSDKRNIAEQDDNNLELA